MLLCSRQNSRIKYVKHLASRKFRRQEKKFIVEGVRFLEEAIQENWPLDLVLHTTQAARVPRTGILLQTLNEQGTPVLAVCDELFKEIADTHSPQGILGVAHMPEMSAKEHLFKPAPEHDLLILTDGIQDPGNLGTIIRCADAFGAGGVLILKGCVDPYSSKVLRSTMGAVFRVPIIQIDDSDWLFEQLHKFGWHIIVGAPKGSLLLQQCDLTDPVVLVVGNEAEGVSEAVLKLAQNSVRIPMPGRAESLNAGIAAGIMLYETLRQRTV